MFATKTKKAKFNTIRDFTRFEEGAHSVLHGLGAVAGIVGASLLLKHVWGAGAAAFTAALIYGISLVVLYTASCLYHACCFRWGDYEYSPARDFFRKCDHSTIFLLILGTYTPAAYALGGGVGIVVFSIVFVACLVGMILNIIDIDKFVKVSMVLYLVAGWTIVFASIPYYKVIGPSGFNLLVAGGLFYTVGDVFYIIRKIPYFHIIWHIFVLLGSIMHFLMVYFYCFN